MKLWLFGSYNWQGNPKALMMYMYKHMRDTHDVWWIADNEKDANEVQSLGYPSVSKNSNKAKKLFLNANVYVTENFRESYPDLNDKTIILNLWHGVGLKHVELALGEESTLSDSIVRKYVSNFTLYKNRVKFLVTSKAMEKHFISDMKLNENQVIRGGYPRNEVYNESSMRTDNDKFSFLDYFNNVYLFAPTYRFTNVNGSFKKLLPNLSAISEVMNKTDSIFIIKLHPFMLKDPDYINAVNQYKKETNIYFWDDKYDIYEVFNKITVGIIDYSSIFYDMLDSGVDKFIRYIPDFEEYISDSELIGDYFELTGGEIAKSFRELINLLNISVPSINNKKELMDYFFEYRNINSIEKMVSKIDLAYPCVNEYPNLYSFDIFDTLIKRNKVVPQSIFYVVQESMTSFKGLPFNDYLLENYPRIRHEVEMDLRESFRKTTYERDTDKIEVSLKQILKRLQNNFNLSDSQIEFLYTKEIEAEIDSVEPIQHRINELFSLKDKGNEIILISDMYLPEEVIKMMLNKADSRLSKLPLYLSSTIGYQKSTGKLFKFIFFNIDYHFNKWIHYGDNKKADGSIPRKLGIQTYNHDMDDFLPNELWYINKSNNNLKNEVYQVSTLFQRRRWELLDECNMVFDKESYYAYSYIGPILVPYVDWAIHDALNRGYETLYFISRDGYYLKQIADVIIKATNIPIKTKFIYGSRKAWRVASFIDEVDPASFTEFGMFASMDSFDDMVKASQLLEDELLEIIPELEGYRNEETLKGDIAKGIRKIFEESDEYKKRLLEISAEQRPIVIKYLQQEINFNEKFAFVEFWGRGYTQDTLSRLLNFAAGKDVLNPFYYVRNFTDDMDTSIRHRFTQMPFNFSDFEFIFATTPYASIPGYEEDYYTGKIKPIFIPQENKFHNAITDNIMKFAHDYVSLDISNQDRLDRFVGEMSYVYHLKHPFDPYISTVFGEFEDNISMYGKPVKFAPVLAVDDLKNKKIKDIRQKTKNIGMSLTKSSEEARRIYRKLQRKEKVKVTNIPKLVYEFPINDLNNYIALQAFPFEVVLIKNDNFYGSVKWSNASKSKYKLKKGTVLTVTGVDWTNHGVPRLKTKYGYITANKKFVTKLRANYNDINNYYYENIKEVIVKKELHYYTGVAFRHKQKKKKIVNPGELINVVGIEWTSGGTPRLKTKHGYITANKKFVTKLRGEHNDIDNYYYKNVKKVLVKKELHYYTDVAFGQEQQKKKTSKPGEIIDIVGIAWTSEGTPRLKTKYGYLSANKAVVSDSKFLMLLKRFY